MKRKQWDGRSYSVQVVDDISTLAQLMPLRVGASIPLLTVKPCIGVGFFDQLPYPGWVTMFTYPLSVKETLDGHAHETRK